MRMPVYYVSNKLVDDITGSGQKRVQISDHTETSKGLGVGIKALLAFFGVDLSLSRTKAHSTVTEIEPSSVDKFLNRLAVIQILPVDEDISLEKESLYSFRTMLSLKEILTRKGRGSSIEASGRLSGVNFKGVTSTQNWSGTGSLVDFFAVFREDRSIWRVFPYKNRQESSQRNGSVFNYRAPIVLLRKEMIGDNMSDAIIYRKRLKYLCAWAAFGANTSYLNSTLRAIQTDLHEDNIIQSKGEVVIVDLDDLFWIDYPADWPKICRAYMPLFRWLDSNRTAAFRFGYLQNGGPIGRMVFDRLRSDYGLNAFREMEDVTYEPDIKTSWNRLSEESVEADRRWRELRDKKLRYGNLRTRKLVYTSVGRWIKELERLSEKLRLSEEERQDVEEYYYLKNLCAAYLNGNGGHLCEAILVLYWINRCRLKLITASGYLYLAKNMLGGYFEKCIAYAERVASRDVRDALAHAREGTEFEECMTARLVDDYENKSVKDIDFLYRRHEWLRVTMFYFLSGA